MDMKSGEKEMMDIVGWKQNILNDDKIKCMIQVSYKDGRTIKTVLKQLSDLPNKPILLMGGAGKPEHILDALKLDQISGVITANLLNFIGDGLKKTREIIINKNINIAKLN